MDKLLLSAEEAAEVLGIGRRRLIPARALVEYVERIAPRDDIGWSTAGYQELVRK
jgi:hypothetical protein